MKVFAKIVFSVSVSITLVLLSVQIISTKPYMMLNEGKYDSHEEITWDYEFAVENIMDYLNGKRDNLYFGASIEMSSILMTERGITHMEDVIDEYGSNMHQRDVVSRAQLSNSTGSVSMEIEAASSGDSGRYGTHTGTSYTRIYANNIITNHVSTNKWEEQASFYSIVLGSILPEILQQSEGAFDWRDHNTQNEKP